MSNRVSVAYAEVVPTRAYANKRFEVTLEKEVNGEDLSEVAKSLFARAKELVEEQKSL